MFEHPKHSPLVYEPDRVNWKRQPMRSVEDQIDNIKYRIRLLISKSTVFVPKLPTYIDDR